MQLIETSLPGVVLVEPTVFQDDRGFFLETFNAERFKALGLPTTFLQDNRSRSRRGVLRGLHYQLRHPQGKLVGVTRGSVFDVAVDIRRGSPTFGRWTSVVLTDECPRFLWIPPGFAHGFCALSETVELSYKCTELYDPADDRGVLWNDARIGVDWPIASPALSPKDSRLPPLDPNRADLPVFGTHEDPATRR